MDSDLDRAVAIATDKTSFMPTRYIWEETQRLLLNMARELHARRLASAYPQGDTADEQEPKNLTKEI
jgi:hypothetical protein